MTGIHRFRIEIPDAELEGLRTRLRAARWPQEAPGGWSRGVPLSYLRELAAYWADGYDWRTHEAQLNELPQFITEIDGQKVHFIHARSGRPDALALLMVHGWPSSPFEFLRVIEPLTEAGFDLVIPSLPGYAFSTPLREGWGNLFRVAGAFAELMRRLGHQRYAVQGTDAGAGVAGMLRMIDGERVTGIHLTGTVAAMPFGPPLDLDGLAGTDCERAERFNRYREDAIGYLHLQATRPQTLAYSLNDSPAGQLAWIVEKFHEWTDPAAELPEQAVERDQLLTNVSIWWFTGSGASAAHAICDGMQAWRAMAAREGAEAEVPAGPPLGVAVFAADTTIRSVMDPGGEIAHWSEFDRGGHFPAMEVPELLVQDVRAFVAGLAGPDPGNP